MTMLDDFRLFVEIARRGSFSGAARDLSLTASQLSKRIKVLEDQLGNTLFIRSARGLSLTGFGRSLYEADGDSILAIHERLNRASVTLPRHFIVHCPQNLMSGPFYPAIRDFLRMMSGEPIDILMESSNSVVSLSQKSFDISIRVGPQSDSSFFHKRLASIAVAVVGLTDVSDKNTLLIPYTAQQAGEKVMGFIQSRFRHIIHMRDITLARQLVNDGLGYGLLPMTEVDLLTTSNERTLEYLSGVLFERQVYAVWPGKRTPGVIAQRLIQCLESLVKSYPPLQGKLID